MLKAGFISLGCSKNLVDTEVMLGILAKNNIEINLLKKNLSQLF